MRLGLHKRRIRIFPAKRHQPVTGYLLFVLAILLILYCSMLFLFRIQPVFLARAGIYANSLAENTINTSISDIFAEDSIGYADLVSVSLGDDGRITAIQSDIQKMNYLKADIASTIQSNLDSNENGVIRIPLGNMFNNEIFSALGPKMSVKVAPAGIVHVDFADEFVSAGINQVKHQIYLNVSVSVSLIFATMAKTENVSSKVLVAETVIVGNIPNYYSSGAPLNAVVN